MEGFWVPSTVGRWHPGAPKPAGTEVSLFPGRQLNRVPRLRREKPWVEKPLHLAGKGAEGVVTR